MSIRLIAAAVAACISCAAGAYVVGKDHGTVPIDPTLPRIVRVGTAFQAHCPEGLWPIPTQTPLTNDRSFYDVSPPAFACIPRKAAPLTRKIWAKDRRSYHVEEYCPDHYGAVPFLGSGGGGGAALSCGRFEWIAALEEQAQRERLPLK